MRHRRDQLMVCRNGISLCLDLMQYIPPQIIDAWQTLRKDRLLSDTLSARQLA